ncbi:MAG TPA: phosphotransferase [Streptosporangiaceae bacterium]|nr:phosphotransferase [Streptosporangiaceae bacterium]
MHCWPGRPARSEHVAAARAPVTTHGEPHSANIIRAGSGRLLIDWDTVGLAPPERASRRPAPGTSRTSRTSRCTRPRDGDRDSPDRDRPEPGPAVSRLPGHDLAG